MCHKSCEPAACRTLTGLESGTGHVPGNLPENLPCGCEKKKVGAHSCFKESRASKDARGSALNNEKEVEVILEGEPANSILALAFQNILIGLNVNVDLLCHM